MRKELSRFLKRLGNYSNCNWCGDCMDKVPWTMDLCHLLSSYIRVCIDNGFYENQVNDLIKLFEHVEKTHYQEDDETIQYNVQLLRDYFTKHGTKE